MLKVQHANNAIRHFLQKTVSGTLLSSYRGGTLNLVLFKKYLLPRENPHMRAHFVAIDQGYKMQPLVGFFHGVESGFRVSHLW